MEVLALDVNGFYAEYRPGMASSDFSTTQEYKEKFKEDIRKQTQGLGLRLAENRIRD